MVTTRYSDQRDPNRDKKLCGSTSNGTDQYQNGSSNLLTPYREQPRSTRNVVAYPRPTFSAKNRKNYGKITLQPVLINKSKILKATHCTEIRKNEIPRSMVVEALSWRSGGKKRKTRPDIARRRERQRDWESCNRTRKRRVLRSDTHWPS